MEKSFQEKNNTTIEILSELIQDPSPDENGQVKYIYKRIYVNYEKKNWTNVIEDINIYQEITKSKKLELLKLKSEFQQFSRKTRMALMESTKNNYIDDNDELDQFYSALSSKNVDDFINGRETNKSKKKQKKITLIQIKLSVD